SASHMQIPEQEREQRPRGNPNWKPGVSQNPRGRETKAQRLARRDAIIAAWAEPHGGGEVPRSAGVELPRIAAEVSMCRRRNAEDRVRHANSISRILAQVGFVEPRRRHKPEPPSPFDDLLSGREP